MNVVVHEDSKLEQQNDLLMAICLHILDFK